MKNKETSGFNLHELNNKNLWLFTSLLAIVYFIFSTFSDGFYMHDEPMFYIYANEIWIIPENYLLAFQKLGYILFLSLPALLGFSFLAFFNSVVSALTVMYSYKILRKLRSKNSFLIFFLMGLQPLWFMLAFRSYSEYLVAFLTVLVVWNHLNKKYIFSALLLSYAALTRSEYHIFLGVYFIMLVFKKQWLPALLTSTFTILHNFMGYMFTDDLMYLPNEVMTYSERMKDTYPKRGFDHYFLMANIIFGSVILMLFGTYLGAKILKKEKPNWLLIIPTLFVVLLNCSLNAQSFTFGPGNGGNLRYLLPVAPLIGMMCVLAIDSVIIMERKHRLLMFLLPLIVLIGMYHTYDHDFIKLLEDGERFWLPLLIAIAVAVIVVLPLKKKQYLISISLLTIIVAISSVRTFPLNTEDATMKKAGKWFAKTMRNAPKQGANAIIKEDAQIATSHILLYYFSGMLKNDFVKQPIHNYKEVDIKDFKKGDIMVWDTHYGYRPKLRPGSLPYDYFDKSAEWEKIQYFQSKDRRFMIMFFRKK